MEQEPLIENDITLWNNFQRSEGKFYWERREFLIGCKNKTQIIKKALNIAGDRGTALRLLLYLNVEERLSFFDELVDSASTAHSDIDLVREVLLSLPKEFLLANIEKSADPILNAVDPYYQYEEYRRLLELYIEIDPELTRRLATKALQSDIEDIHEAGQDFLELLDNC
ncbi:hypothetical protein [Nodularia sp. UHCC 0506]|uniref:hypothetical protein n=1 Tax=Nodularia sp. UHCC 0506 TaxID=3110243 RepID=UPI002B1FB130|nr:hypothetical protein [Nodularia sp. UHCC 0506]MEA5514773.1 hypothetical protein [Nodularia sp. UHCC 0506]